MIFDWLLTLQSWFIKSLTDWLTTVQGAGESLVCVVHSDESPAQWHQAWCSWWRLGHHAAQHHFQRHCRPLPGLVLRPSQLPDRTPVSLSLGCYCPPERQWVCPVAVINPINTSEFILWLLPSLFWMRRWLPHWPGFSNSNNNNKEFIACFE